MTINNPLPHADYIYLSKFYTLAMDDIELGHFQYDHVSDKQILEALNDVESLSKVNPDLDWEDDSFLYDTDTVKEEDKHAYRIAALIRSIQKEGVKHAIEFDTFSMDRCLSSIPNGHHRIRALQYLSIDIVPFCMNGHLDLIEPILAYAGVPGYLPTLTAQE